MGGYSWVKGCKIFGFLCQGERLREGVEVGLQVGRPGRKECAGCEQVGVAELCVWVPRCGENLQVFWGFAQTRTTRPTSLGRPRVPPQILDTWLYPEPGIRDPEAQELLPSLCSAYRG